MSAAAKPAAQIADDQITQEHRIAIQVAFECMQAYRQALQKVADWDDES